MSDDANLLTTPLYELHLAAGAKMVPFAGYAMPVQYPMGILKEHLHTRKKAGLFDVSHMGQIHLKGADAAAALEQLVPVDIVDLPRMKQRYALFTHEQGGVLDDLMVTRLDTGLFLVVNAACKSQDIAHLQRHLSEQCKIEVLDDRALLALQGPEAKTVMQKLAPDVADMTFMTAKNLTLAGIDCLVTRSGYTVEDGFEISVPALKAKELAQHFLAESDVEWIGLGARDSLRLEAGLCLYGHELSPDITPVEAKLNWALSPARRANGIRAGGYLGAETIMKQFQDGVARQRVGIQPEGKMPVRAGAVLQNGSGEVVGVVTSGGFSPTLNRPIAVALVDSDAAAVATKLYASVRNKKVAVSVVALPFVKQNYYRG